MCGIRGYVMSQRTVGGRSWVGSQQLAGAWAYGTSSGGPHARVARECRCRNKRVSQASRTCLGDGLMVVHVWSSCRPTGLTRHSGCTAAGGTRGTRGAKCKAAPRSNLSKTTFVSCNACCIQFDHQGADPRGSVYSFATTLRLMGERKCEAKVVCWSAGKIYGYYFF